MGFRGARANCVVEQVWPGLSVEPASAQLVRIARAASRGRDGERTRVLGATLIPDDETVFTWCVAPLLAFALGNGCHGQLAPTRARGPPSAYVETLPPTECSSRGPEPKLPMVDERPPRRVH